MVDIYKDNISDLDLDQIPKEEKKLARDFDAESDSLTKNIVCKSGEKVYKDAVLITPGEWPDSASNMYNYWPEDTLREYSDNIRKNNLTLDHSTRECLARIGTVENIHWDGKKKAVVGDIHIKEAGKGKQIIELIEAGLINGLSVDAGTVDTWDYEKNMPRVDYIEWYGASIVPADEAACEEAGIYP